MSNFWQIKKKDYYWTAIELKKHLPELKNSYTEDVVNNLRGSGLGVVEQKSVPVEWWIRFTMPFGLILFVLLFLLLPVKFMLTGSWHYRVQWISNWFKSLGF